MTITNFWKRFCYGVNSDHYKKLIGIRELLERLHLYFLNNPSSTDTGTQKNIIPPLDEVNEVETVSTCRANHLSSYIYSSTEASTIYNTTINIASLVTSTIACQNNSGT